MENEWSSSSLLEMTSSFLKVGKFFKYLKAGMYQITCTIYYEVSLS